MAHERLGVPNLSSTAALELHTVTGEITGERRSFLSA